MDPIGDMFKGKRLLITGGTGSFGNAVLRKFLQSDLEEIRVFSRDEKKQEDMRIALASPKLRFHIGDVREPGSVRSAMRGIDFVFHAAALKQVPSCEFYPMEAVRTNILGTENVLNAALAEGVKRVVVLSTDKAVYPINAMGMSKALMEKIAVAKSREPSEGGTVICATRYGNVMASRGSVIPLFVSQIRQQRALTVTDPNMTRFMMSLEESVDLVLYAFCHGKQGDTFVQKSPAATIGVLADALKRIFGSERLETRIIGTRHGEKTYEVLVSREEMARAESMARYFRVPADTRDLNYSKYFTTGETAISTLEDYTSHNTTRLDVEQTQQLLLNLNYIKDELSGRRGEIT
jgi:UDP-N-acetylglucosamine 4,6-dehydratase